METAFKTNSFMLFCGLLISLLQLSETAHILFMHQAASYSHVASTSPLANALVAKGHTATFIAAHKPKVLNPKIKYINPQQMMDYVIPATTEGFDVGARLENKMPFCPTAMPGYALTICNLTLTSPEVQEWLSSKPKVDLIYVDTVHECATGLSHYLNAKLAVYVAGPFWSRLIDILGMPDESNSVQSWVYTFAKGEGPLDSFIARVINALLSPFENFYYKELLGDEYQKIFKKAFGLTQDMPSISELEKNISLVLLSGNSLSEFQRSLPPMCVRVGGMHVTDETNPLDKKLEAFIQSDSSKGFVYISLGTIATASKLPKSVINSILGSMKSFPEFKFLWKWDGPLPEVIPNNLFISSWFSQQDVLGHPKIKGFVTQTGRPSTQEAIAKGVPIITLPVGGDQDLNALRLEDLGVSVPLEITTLTETKFTTALREILFNSRYKEAATRVSKLATDQPMKPVEVGVWWTEFVLRHDDLSHLKPLGRNQTWYQRRQLDVWAFVFVSVLSIISIVVLVCYCLLRKLVTVVWVENKEKIN